MSMPIKITSLGYADRIGVELKPDMIRQDFTMKSNQGYLGQIKDNEGRKMTEQSIDVDMDLFGEEKTYHMPLLVPGLNNEEIASIKAGEKDTPAAESAYAKAVEHGKQRLLKGKDPFFQEGEDINEKYFFTDDRNIVLESDEVPITANQSSRSEDDMVADYIANWEKNIGEAKHLEYTKDGKPFKEKGVTIGYGHYDETGEYKVGDKINPEQARELLNKDIAVRMPEIKKAIPNFDKFDLDTKQNIVSAWFRGSLKANHNTTKLINEGKFKEAAQEFLNHEGYKKNWLPQKERRLKENQDVSTSVATRMEAVANALANQKDLDVSN